MSPLPVPPMPHLPCRERDSHKGSYGHALLIGGSRGMAGSISLTSRAALISGAGLVTQAVPESIVDSVAILNPGAMTLPLAQDAAGRICAQSLETIVERFDKSTCLALGPGIGRSSDLQSLVMDLFESSPKTLVLDADGLNNLADALAGESSPTLQHRAPRILTPHPGEWSRLCGVPASDPQGQREQAIEWARDREWIIVLKGHETLVTDGHTAYYNTTGTPAMATGGSGDVLTGVITALVCQGLQPREAAQLGVYAHGLAGQLAEQSLGARVVLAEQLIQFIDRALGTVVRA